MRNNYLLWFALFITGGTSAQPIDTWFKGSVTLTDDRVLVGQLSIKVPADFLILRSVEGKTAFLAHKIKSFRYYDSIGNINRQFMSIKDSPSFQHWKLFEVVMQGKLKVLRRPRVQVFSNSLHEIDDYNYFVWHNEKLIPIKKFRSVIYPELMREKPIQIEQFVSSHHLNINEMKAALLILKEYNQLQNQKRLLAKLD